MESISRPGPTPRRRLPLAGHDTASSELTRLEIALHAAVDALVAWLAENRVSTPTANTVDANDLLDVPAAAARLGISETALRRFVRSGTLPSIRLGRRMLFRPSVLDAFIQSHESAVRPLVRVG